MNDQNFVTWSGHVECVHYYGKSIAVVTDKEEIRLFRNPQEIFVIEQINRGLSIQEISQEICKTFLDATVDIKDVQNVIYNFVNSGTNRYLFEEKNDGFCMKTPTGQRDKFFPLRLQIELTNKCNFSCKHCYKEASASGRHIEISFLENLLSYLPYDLHEIGLTGGEPILHPEFATIVKMCRMKCKYLELNTNGTLLHTVNEELIKSFDRISISIYGLDDNQYSTNVGISTGFSHLKQSCEKLLKADMAFGFSVLLTKANMNEIIEYVDIAHRLGASTIKFGTINKIGRANSSESDSVLLTPEELRKAYRIIRAVIPKYKDKIRITEWTREVYNSKSINNTMYHLNGTSPFMCSAGTLQWGISELNLFRPCVLMPNCENMVFDYESWKRHICGENTIDWTKYTENMSAYCELNGQQVEDFCNRLVF